MKYLLLLYGDESQWANASPEDIERELAEYQSFSSEINGAGVFISGEALEATNSATTLRIRHGESSLTDGPFAETREQLGGYYLLDCKDLDEAVTWASKIPAAQTGSVEIRPVMNYDDYDSEHPDAEQAGS
jgi:hypothetical protein